MRPGVREYDVVAEAMHTLFRLGGEMAHLASPFVASGEHMSPPNRFPSDKLIREGIPQAGFDTTRTFLANYSNLWAQDVSRRLGFAIDGIVYGKDLT